MVATADCGGINFLGNHLNCLALHALGRVVFEVALPGLAKEPTQRLGILSEVGVA